MTANPKLRFVVTVIEDGRPIPKNKVAFSNIYIVLTGPWLNLALKKFLTSAKMERPHHFFMFRSRANERFSNSII